MLAEQRERERERCELHSSQYLWRSRVRDPTTEEKRCPWQKDVAIFERQELIGRLGSATLSQLAFLRELGKATQIYQTWTIKYVKRETQK